MCVEETISLRFDGCYGSETRSFRGSISKDISCDQNKSTLESVERIQQRFSMQLGLNDVIIAFHELFMSFAKMG